MYIQHLQTKPHSSALTFRFAEIVPSFFHQPIIFYRLVWCALLSFALHAFRPDYNMVLFYIFFLSFARRYLHLAGSSCCWERWVLGTAAVLFLTSDTVFLILYKSLYPKTKPRLLRVMLFESNAHDSWRFFIFIFLSLLCGMIYDSD